MSLPKRERRYCAEVNADDPRKGEVCGREIYAPHDACERHRPKRKHSGGRPTKEQAREASERFQRRKRMAGIPVGWVL